jgi:adenylate cyclase
MPNVCILPERTAVDCGGSEALLRAALRAGIPFAHACGGNAICSTCRVVVVEGADGCSPRTPKERTVADRLRFGPELRLACQMRVTGDVTVRRLVLDQYDLEQADLRHRRRHAQSVVRSGLGGGRRKKAERGPRSVGEELPVSVLFADIRGFTSFAEALLPYDVIHVLQRHFHETTVSIERHDGVVTSYMGDGIMALFGPSGGDRSARRAARAGFEILADIDRRRGDLEALYGRAFDVNVGLHHGPAIVGSVWGGPASLTAIGDTVNMASRIEQANKLLGTRFLVSEAARDELGEEAVVGRSARCALPGKAGQHTLLELVGLR